MPNCLETRSWSLLRTKTAEKNWKIIIMNHLKTKTPLKLFGVPRSGGTLICNVTRQLIKNCKTQPQSHRFFNDSHKVIVTYRDFRDCVLSLWRVEHGRFDEIDQIKTAEFKDLRGSIRKIKKTVHHLNLFRDRWDQNNVLYFRYEDWFDNFDHIFKKFEEFFELKIEENQRDLVRKKCDLSTVKKQSKSLSNFDDHDPLTCIHGQHIFTGEVGTWKKLLKQADHEKLTDALCWELKEWGYVEPKLKKTPRIFTDGVYVRNSLKLWRQGVRKGIKKILSGTR